MLAGGFVFFLLVNAQLLLAALFGPGAIKAATLPLQMVAMAGMILGLISSGSITNLLLAHANDAGGGILWNPAAWFVGIYRWVAGDARPVFAMLAIRGAIAGVGMIALTMIMYPLAYERCLRNVIAAEGRRTTAMSRGWASLAARLLRPLLPWPLQRGIAAFMLATLGRSHTHRFIIGLYAGLAFLLSLPLVDRLSQLPLTGHYNYGWFAIPLGYVFWAVCGAARVADDAGRAGRELDLQAHRAGRQAQGADDGRHRDDVDHRAADRRGIRRRGARPRIRAPRRERVPDRRLSPACA